MDNTFRKAQLDFIMAVMDRERRHGHTMVHVSPTEKLCCETRFMVSSIPAPGEAQEELYVSKLQPDYLHIVEGQLRVHCRYNGPGYLLPEYDINIDYLDQDDLNTIIKYIITD